MDKEIEIITKLTEISETETIKVFLSLVVQISFEKNKRLEAYLCFNEGVYEQNTKISFFIRESTEVFSNIILLHFLANEKILKSTVLIKQIIPMHIDDRLIFNIRTLIRDITLINHVFFYPLKFESLRDVVLFLCNTNLENEKEKLKQEYDNKLCSLNKKFYIKELQDEKTDDMHKNICFFELYIINNPKINDKRIWLVIQKGQLCGKGYTREEAYNTARANPNYVSNEDRLFCCY